MSFLSSLWPSQILKDLHKSGEASTFERLTSSRHVVDLRLIFVITLATMIIGLVIAAIFGFFQKFTAAGAFAGAIVTVGGGVLAWTYQTGSIRLGVVDLFACEIATLCKVAVVVDMVSRYIDLARSGPAATSRRAMDNDMPRVSTQFTSKESYFPVFDSSVKDLQKLEADVVQNVTAFYTYMKVTRDYLRKLADLHPPVDGSIGDGDWTRAVANLIYTIFLGLESARKSIKDLVEFQPTRAEDIFTILLNELRAYDFLRNYFKNGLRQQALNMRQEKYKEEVEDLYNEVTKMTGPKWERAKMVAEEAMSLYREVFASETTAAALSFRRAA